MYAVALVAVLGTAGCAARRTGDAVRSTHFVGNSRPTAVAEWLTASQTDRALRNAMTHPTGSWQSFLFPRLIEPTWLDPVMLDRDGWRLEVWYANHGYFDARFLGWEIGHPPRPAGRRVRPVDLVGHVEQGEPSRIASIDVSGTEKLGAPLVRRIWSTLSIAKGDIWSTDDYRQSIAAVEALLRERSFAHALVHGQVAVDPVDHEVQVTLTVEAGHPCRFGPVSVVGLKRINADELHPLIDIKEGAPYRESQLKTARERLFALGVLGVVNILPDLSDPGGRTVPIRIELTESKSHEVKAGPELEFEPGLQTLAVAATYTDNNVFNRLWQTSQTARIGVASDVTTMNDVRRATFSPIGSISGNFNLPRLFSSSFSILNTGSVGRTLTSYGDVASAEFSPAAAFTGVAHLAPTIGYRIRYEDLLGSSDKCTLQANQFGAASEYPYLLSELEQSLAWDSRNDPLSPTRGWYWNIHLAEAGGPFGGLYDFFKVEAEVRAYRSILRLAHQEVGTTVAGRLGGGLIQPYSETTAIPLEERLFLGGGTTVRGWAADHLGPVGVTDCGDVIPLGGNLQLYGNLELRQPLPFYPDLTIATFLDAGRVWDTPQNIRLAGVQYSVGGGLRYNTAIGPIRLDAAWRLGDPDAFDGRMEPTQDIGPGAAAALAPLPDHQVIPPEGRWALHFGLSEAF